MTPRRAAGFAGGVLLVVYIATLAPSVTFWDAGEFIAAARVLGIPHPPGTPLFIVALNAWARLFWFLPFAVATNLFSAVCTAGGGALGAWWIARATRMPWLGVAAAITAGAMSSIWQNATETEVYAASFVVSVAAIVAGDLAGRTGERRWLVLAAYLLALAGPLHLSVLVVAPVVIYLAAQRGDGSWDIGAGVALLGVTVAAIGVGRVSLVLCVIGLVIVAAAAVIPREPVIPSAARDRSPWKAIRRRFAPRDDSPVRTSATIILSVAIACSALLILLIRARFDPAINQANPSSFHQLIYAIGRRQYDVAGLWPRQAPLWLQAANWFEYADWQFALSLAPTVIPTVARVLATVAFAGLAVIGCQHHRQLDRRTWRAVVLLFACGSIGVGVYLNLKAGASFGYPFVPDAARHEARDRDYFFVLSFWAWGVWSGIGAVALARRVRAPAMVGLVVAALPIALNWSAVSRRTEPEASLPRELASALLDSLPPRTVLFVAGDNDTYPIWYLQQVEGRRRDVTLVTMPLLGARWYPEELDRREHLLKGRTVGDVPTLSGWIAQSAREGGRPVAAAVTVPASDRNRLSKNWKVIGLSYLDQSELPSDGYRLNASAPVITIDSAAAKQAAANVARWARGRVAHPSIDPVHEYFFAVLSCPNLFVQARTKGQLASLDSLCNLR